MDISKEKYAEILEEIHEMLKSNECAECSCPNVRCEWHGDCYDCVRIYRHFGNHVPRCLQFVLDKKTEKIRESIELQMRKKPIPPDEYRDYVLQRSKKATLPEI